MEILLILILISILWGNTISSTIESSIISSIKDISFEFQHGQTNKLLREIRYALPEASTDYSYDLERLRDGLEKLHAELGDVNETLKEIIEAQQEAVVKLDDLIEVCSEVN